MTKGLAARGYTKEDAERFAAAHDYEAWLGQQRSPQVRALHEHTSGLIRWQAERIAQLERQSDRQATAFRRFMYEPCRCDVEAKCDRCQEVDAAMQPTPSIEKGTA